VLLCIRAAADEMLTVLMATRNRASLLSSVLESFENLEAPLGDWKLVVVDNGSTDATLQVLNAFATRLPMVHVFEERTGKNHALNTGLNFLEGDLAVFTDDDVFPDPDWLVRMRAAADAQHSYAIFGGAILPRWEIPPPEWVHLVNMESMFGVTDPSLTDGPTERGAFFGANLAMRAEIFKRGTRFDVSIGPRGSEYAMGGESELVNRLHREGHKAWHVQGARVEHFIAAGHLTKSWVLNRAIRSGRGGYRQDHAVNPSAARWPLYLVPRIFKRGVRIARAWTGSNEEDLLKARWELNYLWGHFVEARVGRRGEGLSDHEEGERVNERHQISE